VTGLLLALVAVLVVAVLAVGEWYAGTVEKDALRSRTMLDIVEARADRRGNRIDARLRRTSWGRRIQQRIDRAGVAYRVVDVVAVLVGIVAGGTYLLTQVITWYVALITSAALAWLSLNYFSRKENQRREAFIAQLPEVARVLSNATSAGLALRSAIQMAASDLAEPAGVEIHRLAEELDLGTSLSDALGNLEERLPSRELSLLTRTLVIQARAGGAVVTALRAMSDTLDARKDLRRELHTMLSGAVFTSWAVLVLGVGSLLVLNLMQPNTLHRMTSVPLGQAALALAVALYAFGFVIIRRLTRIEV
jgi:tight adherence protein B